MPSYPETLSTEFYLADERWALIACHLPGKEGDPGCHARDNRLFIEAVFWIIRKNKSWRSLPPEFGKWYTVYTRYRRWTLNGVWPAVLGALAADGASEFCYDNGEIRYQPSQCCHLEENSEASPERVA